MDYKVGDFMEITEVVKDVEKAVGGKQNLIIIGVGFVVLFIGLSMSQSKNDSSSDLQLVSGIASYPDAVTNADTIISSIQNSLNYISEENSALYEQGMKDLDEKLTATENYINDGFESQKTIFNSQVQELQGDIKEVNNTITNQTNIINSTPKIANLSSLPTLQTGGSIAQLNQVKSGNLISTKKIPMTAKKG